MDWQSPTNHPLLMAQALSELIKRHFFTSPDAREKRRRKERGRRKEPEGGILLSLYPGLLVNKDFSQCPLLFLYPFILPWVEKRGRKEGEEKIVFPIMFCQVVFFFFFCHMKNNWLQVKNASAELQPFRQERGSSQMWEASRQPRPPRSANEKCNFSLPVVCLNP